MKRPSRRGFPLYKLSEFTLNHKRRPNGFWLSKNTPFMSDWWNANMVSMMVVWYWLVAVSQIEQLEIFYQAGIDLPDFGFELCNRGQFIPDVSFIVENTGILSSRPGSLWFWYLWTGFSEILASLSQLQSYSHHLKSGLNPLMYYGRVQIFLHKVTNLDRKFINRICSKITLLYVGKFGSSRNSENLGSLKGKNDSIERAYAKWVACDGNKTVIFDQIIIMQKILKS